MSQSIIFQSCWDRVTTSLVLTNSLGSNCVLFKDTTLSRIQTRDLSIQSTDALPLARKHSEKLPLRKHFHMIYRDFFIEKIENTVKIENFNWIFFFYIFLISAQNIDCGYTLEPPRRGGSNKYPQSMFWSKNKKNR